MKIEDIKNELNSELQRTENGALGYATSGKALLDMNFKTSSMRNMSDKDILALFHEAMAEDPKITIKWLFFLRDREQGMGERKSFRIMLKDLCEDRPNLVMKLIPLVPYYGRWDDLWRLLDSDNAKVFNTLIYIVGNQLSADMQNMKSKYPISLLGKWLPSLSSKKQENRRWAAKIRKALFLSKEEYRIIYTSLRKYLDVVEVKMSDKEWSKINYEAVPSRANLLYRNAFLRNDEARRVEYLESLKKGKTKINAKVLSASDIVHNYYDTECWSENIKPYDESLEQLWKNLPNYMPDGASAIVVSDSSGSMTTRVGNTNLTAYQVAEALAIYMSERLTGEFKDCFITFSSKPQLLNMSNFKSLHEKLKYYDSEALMSNTNIKAVFDLILRVAVNNHYSQEDLPQNIIICSDMEFDEAQGYYMWRERDIRCAKADFEVIKDEYAKHGYKMPSLTFWNIYGRTNTVPLQENELGVHLLSGFSQAIVDMAFSTKLDPYECLIERLNSERYDMVEEVLSDEQ